MVTLRAFPGALFDRFANSPEKCASTAAGDDQLKRLHYTNAESVPVVALPSIHSEVDRVLFQEPEANAPTANRQLAGVAPGSSYESDAEQVEPV